MNSWVQHVKQVQSENGISYKDALTLAKQTYQGGALRSKKGNYVRFLYHKNNFDPSLIKITPSKNIIKKQKQKKRNQDYEEYKALEREFEKIVNKKI